MLAAMEDMAHALIYDATMMGQGLLPTERVASVTVHTRDRQ
jgi:hypothetical protein